MIEAFWSRLKPNPQIKRDKRSLINANDISGNGSTAAGGNLTYSRHPNL